MSKHVGRKHRWTRTDAKTYLSASGKVVFERGAWHATFVRRLQTPPEREGGLPDTDTVSRRLGPFKRPRDAMVALEREITALKNRHGEKVAFDEPSRTGTKRGGPDVESE
jgi:hypothetical protein